MVIPLKQPMLFDHRVTLEARRRKMSDEVLRSLSWVALAVGIVAVFMILEVLLRTLTNRYGTQQDQYPHRVGNQVARPQQ